MRPTLIAATLLGLSSACQSFFPPVRGSGLVMTDTRQVGGFCAIDVSGSATVLLTQGGEESLDIECDDNLLPHILASVDDGVLRIRFERGNWRPSEGPIYRIGVRDLDSVQLRGSTRLEASALHGDDMDLRLSGSGVAEIEGIDAHRVRLMTSGSGSLSLGYLRAQDAHVGISGSGLVHVASGTVGTIDVQTSGSGDLDMTDVEVKQANLRLSGSGTAQIWVEEKLHASVRGSGMIGYRGRPVIQASISGSGAVYPIGAEAK